MIACGCKGSAARHVREALWGITIGSFSWLPFYNCIIVERLELKWTMPNLKLSPHEQLDQATSHTSSERGGTHHAGLLVHAPAFVLHCFVAKSARH